MAENSRTSGDEPDPMIADPSDHDTARRAALSPILGHDATPDRPRWSIVRDVLHWME